VEARPSPNDFPARKRSGGIASPQTYFDGIVAGSTRAGLYGVTGARMKQTVLAGLLIGALLTGCATMNDSKEPATAVVSGDVTYLQRIALPPDAVVTVRLQDISKMDVPAVLLGEQQIETGGRQVPIPFEVQYDPARIDDRMTYSVSARIRRGDELLWVSDTVHPVITRGAPTSGIQLKVVPVQR
jgi:putative lipoprotein